VRLLADENFPGVAIDRIRAEGHDVLWIRTDAPGTAGPQVLALAVAENRVLITFDKDFGELAFKAHLPASSGVVLFRISPSSPEHVSRVAATTLASRQDWAGNFAVVEDERIRMTPLP